MAAFREARLDKKNDDELLSMIRILRQWQASQHPPEAPHAIEAIEKEIVSREKKRLHQEMIAEQERLHGAQNVFAERLDKKSSAEEAVRHKKTQCVAWVAAGIGFLSLVVGSAALYFQITSKPGLPLEKSPPAITNKSELETRLSVSTNFQPAIFVSATNQVRPITTNKQFQ